MAQHDMVLNDQPGANFRSDLNAALAALVSLSSSAGVDPYTGYGTVPFQLWADSTAGILKQRNAANNGWVNLVTMSTGANAANAALAGSTAQDFSAKILTVDNLLKLKTGTNIASASNLNLSTATGNLVHITGTTTTTDLTMAAGQQMICIADSAWPLTYNVTTLRLNTGASYTCTAGDIIEFYYDGTTKFANLVRIGMAPAYLGATQIFTTPQRGAVTDNGSSLNFNLATSNNFKCAVSTSSAITFSNITAGQTGSILFVQTGSSAPTYAGTTHINATDLATLGVAGTYLINYASLGGTNVECVVSRKLAP